MYIDWCYKVVWSPNEKQTDYVLKVVQSYGIRSTTSSRVDSSHNPCSLSLQASYNLLPQYKKRPIWLCSCACLSEELMQQSWFEGWVIGIWLASSCFVLGICIFCFWFTGASVLAGYKIWNGGFHSSNWDESF